MFEGVINNVLSFLIKNLPMFDSYLNISGMLDNREITSECTKLFIFLIITMSFIFFIFYVFNILLYIYKLYKIRNVFKCSNLGVDNEVIRKLRNNKQTAFIGQNLTSYNNKIYSVQSIDFYFNEDTFAPSFLKSRFLTSGPALLTGLGVLGTFAGLMLGLDGLKLDGDVSRLQEEIRRVAQGASVAFVTSVVGVSCSLTLNLFEKIVSGIAAVLLRNLQDKISNLFPPFPTSDVILDLRQNSRDSTDVLSGLAEQIGNSMQQSLDSFLQSMFEKIAENMSKSAEQISNAIENSIEKSIYSNLVPSIDRISSVATDLANRQNENAEQALRQLLDKFIENIGQQGNNQREMMESATNEFQDSVLKFSSFMKDISVQMNEQQRFLISKQQEQMERLEASFKNITEEQKSNQEISRNNTVQLIRELKDKLSYEFAKQTNSLCDITDQLHNTISNMTKSIDHLFQEIDNKQQDSLETQIEINKNLLTNTHSMFDQQLVSMKAMKSVLQQNIEASKTIIEQGSILRENSRADQKNLLELYDNIKSACDEFSSASQKLVNFSDSLQESINKNSQAVDKSVNLYSLVNSSYNAVLDELNNILHDLSELKDSLEEVSRETNHTIKNATENYHQLVDSLQSYQKDMKEVSIHQVQDLDEHMTELLKNYGEMVNRQVDERMVQWNKQTENFCDTLTNVITSMGEIVDDIDSKRR